MVDVANLPPGELTASDFAFNVAAPPAAITVRRGAGADGSDRVILVWADGAIVNQWLRVTVLATERTGLSAPDVFAFGNLVGDTGDAPAGSGRAVVNATDVVRTLAHVSPAAPLGSLYDHNRDGRVNALDLALARANQFHELALPAVGAPTQLPAALTKRLDSDRPTGLLEDSATGPL
jgi:hypothetical protein